MKSPLVVRVFDSTLAPLPFTLWPITPLSLCFFLTPAAVSDPAHALFFII